MSQDEEGGDDDTTWRDVFLIMYEKITKAPIREWNRRTWFGKILYPGWFLIGAVGWIIFVPIIVGVAAVYILVETLPKKLKEILPPKYKPEGT